MYSSFVQLSTFCEGSWAIILSIDFKWSHHTKANFVDAIINKLMSKLAGWTSSSVNLIAWHSMELTSKHSNYLDFYCEEVHLYMLKLCFRMLRCLHWVQYISVYTNMSGKHKSVLWLENPNGSSLFSCISWEQLHLLPQVLFFL